jgi:hypothetical protein
MEPQSDTQDKKLIKKDTLFNIDLQPTHDELYSSIVHIDPSIYTIYTNDNTIDRNTNTTIMKEIETIVKRISNHPIYSKQLDEYNPLNSISTLDELSTHPQSKMILSLYYHLKN